MNYCDPIRVRIRFHAEDDSFILAGGGNAGSSRPLPPGGCSTVAAILYYPVDCAPGEAKGGCDLVPRVSSVP